MSKVVTLEDDGFKYEVVVPDDAPKSQYRFGIRVGPPSLASLKLPKELERRLNNALHSRGLLTKSDVRSRRMEVLAAWQGALTVDVGLIVDLYEGDSNNDGS